MTASADTTRRVKQSIVRALGLHIDFEEIPDDEALFDGGLGLDSVAALEIVCAVEEEFAIEVDDDDLQAELLASVAALARYVEARRAESAADPL